MELLRFLVSPPFLTILFGLPPLALIGLGAVSSRWVWHRFLVNCGSHPLPLFAVAFFGILLLLVGIIFLTSQRAPQQQRPGDKSWAGVQMLLGVGLLLFVGFVTAHEWERIQQFFGMADFASADKLKNLRAADLDRNAEPAGDWSQWRGPRRDGKSSETGLNTDWKAKPLKEVWRSPIRGGYSSIAVANDRLFTMDRQHHEERVLCFNAKDGKEVWTHAYSTDYAGIDYGDGPRATPTVHKDRVYTLGATGVFLCLEARPADNKPKELWRHELAKEFKAPALAWGMACSPLIEGDLVIVQPGGSDGSVAAFDLESGKLKWKALSDVSGYSSPVAATIAGIRQIICFTARGISGLAAADGKELWHYPWSTRYDGNIATPLVAGNYVFISSGYNKGCALLELSNDANGGIQVEPVWVKNNKLMRNHHATCVLHNGFLYGYDDGILKCIDLRTAEEKWSSRTPEKGTLLYVDGHLIVLTENGQLAIVEATPEAFRGKGSLELFDTGQTWALPALSGGRLYVRDKRFLVCLDLK